MRDILEMSYENARSVCENLYLDAPELELDVSDEEVTSTYPCAHLEYIFFEILKNAMKATMERYETSSGRQLQPSIPPIKVQRALENLERSRIL